MSERKTTTAPAREAGSRPSQPPKPVANIIAIASGKGGVGKTWLAVSLSQALARNGKSVLLFDGDLGLANVNVQLGLMPKHDLNSVIRGATGLKTAAMTFEEGGFDIIAGRSGTGSLAALPSARLGLLRRELESLAGSYDLVILDLGAGVDTTVRTMAGAAARTIVVTTDEPTALTDAYAFIKLSHQSGLADGIKIVVNMAHSKTDGERTHAQLTKVCQGFLKIAPPLAGVVRRDTKVRDAIRAQTPILTRSPQADAAVDVEALAHHLLED